MSEPASAPEPGRSVAVPADRRAFVRLASDLDASCRPAGPAREVAWPGKVRDISCGGVGLILRHRFRPGTFLAVELRTANGKLLRSLLARVVHVTPVLVEGNPSWLLGCAFDQPLSDDEFQTLL